MSTLLTTNLKNPSSGSNNIVLETDGRTTVAAPNILKLATSVASTSGTSVDFTSIPSWVKRVTVMFSGVSVSGTSLIQVQLGDSGGFETSSYLGAVWSANTNNSLLSAGFLISATTAAAATYHGSTVLTLLGSNNWIIQGVIGRSDSTNPSIVGGSKTLSATLDRIRITTVNGTDTFDGGSINILYEG